MKRLLILALLLLGTVAHADCVLQADTADTGFALGPFLDETDGITPETALTITSAEVLLKKKGGTSFAAKNDATSCTHRSNGWYTCPIDATDTNTEGNMIVAVTESGAVPVWRECTVMASGYYDVFDGTTSLMTSRQAGNMLETTVSSVTSQTILVLAAGSSVDDSYYKATIEVVDAAGAGECVRTVEDYTGSTTTVTMDAACEFTVAASDTVRIHVGASGRALETLDAAVAALNDISPTEVNAQADTAISDAGLGNIIALSSTADSGTATTIVDAALDESTTDYWANGHAAIVNFTNGEQARCIASFTPATDTLTVTPAFTQAVSTETYVIVNEPTCIITASMIATDAITASAIASSAIGSSEIANDAITEAKLASNSITTSELDSTAVNEIWNKDLEDQGVGYSAQEILSLLLSEAMGTCTYTQGTRTWVCKDPSGTETRFTLVYGSELDGDRSTSTPAPATL